MRRVVRNGLFNSGGWIAQVVIGFAVTPYFVVMLSPEGYGVFALLTGLIGYYNLMDLGLAWGVTKFVAQYHARGDRVSLSASINAALFVQATTGSVASIALVTFADPILRVLRVPAAYLADARVGLYLVAAGFLIAMLSGTMAAAVKGLQRYDLTSKVKVAVELAKNLGMVVALVLGYGLLGMVVVVVAASVVALIANLVVLRREVPDWTPGVGARPRHIREMLGFSGFVFLSHVSGGLFMDYVLRFVIGAFLGPAAVTYYVVPLKLVKAVRGLMSNGLNAVFPYASELGERGDRASLKRAWLKGTRLSVALAAPFYFVLAIFSKPVMTLWMGASFAEETWAFVSLLALHSLFASLTIVPIHIALGLGYARLHSYFTVTSVGLYLVVLPLLTERYGVAGSIVAMMIANGLPGLAFVMVATRRIMGHPAFSFLWHVMAFHLAPFALASLLLVTGAPSSIPLTAWVAAGSFAVGGAYVGAMAVTGWLDDVVRLGRRPGRRARA